MGLLGLAEISPETMCAKACASLEIFNCDSNWACSSSPQLLWPGCMSSKGEVLVLRREQTLQMTTVEGRVAEDSGAGRGQKEL